MRTETIRVTAEISEPKRVFATLMDQTLSRVAVPVVFFYRQSVPEQTLIAGLCQVLNAFPVFASSPIMINGRLAFDCNNQGVDLVVTHRSERMAEVIPRVNQGEGKRLAEIIQPNRVLSGRQPVMTLKISYYRCGGMSVGACWYHPVGDMHSFMSFYQAWTAALAGEEMVAPGLIMDREDYLKAHLPENHKAKPGYRYLSLLGLVRLLVYLLTGAKDQCFLQIYFTPSELAALKAFYMAETGTRLSTNDVVCGHMFNLIAESDAPPKSRFLSVAVDYRERMALPKNLLGNMITSINLKFDAGSSAAEVATGLRAAVNDFDSHMDYRANHALFSGLGKKADVNRLIPAALDPMNGNLLITNWCNQRIYAAKMGGEGPLYFSPLPNVPFPWGSALVEGPEGEGMLYTVVLPRKVGEKLLRKTEAIHRFRDPADEIAPLFSFLQ